MCPNFGHPALSSSFTKHNLWQINTNFAINVNELSVLKLLQLLNCDLLLSWYAFSIYKLRKPRMTNLAQGVRSWGTPLY